MGRNRAALNGLILVLSMLLSGIGCVWADAVYGAETIVADMSGDVKPTNIVFEWEKYIITAPDCPECTIEFYIDGGDAVASFDAEAETHTVPYLDDSMSHNYWIRAKNTEGMSGTSTIVQVDPWIPPIVDPDPAVTPPQPPTAPRNMIITITLPADQVTVTQ